MAAGLNHNFATTAGVIVVRPGDVYSDAISRDAMSKTSVQCDQDMIVQISNYPEPSMSNDDEWYDAASGKFVPVNPSPFMWMRVKLLAPATDYVNCFICSERSNY